MPMQPMESRRSRKQREVVYQNGIQSSVLKEISTPRPDGSIPLISFLENVNYSIMELYDFNSRISLLEDIEKKGDLLKKGDMEEIVKNNSAWKEDISEKIDTIETNVSNDLIEVKEEISGRIKFIETKVSNDLIEVKEKISGRIKFIETNVSNDLIEVKEEISGRIKFIETKVSNDLIEVKEDISERIDSIKAATSKNLIEIKNIASKNKFIEIMKMENDISNQYYKIHEKLDDYVNEQCNKLLNSIRPAIRSFSDNLKKLIETKVISFDDLLEKTRIELKHNVKEVSINVKSEYNNLISQLTQLSEKMNKDIMEKKDDENLSIEIRMKKDSCFNNIYMEIKNKYKVTQLSLQTLYINILSDISSVCSFIFGKIEALLQNGSMSDVQLILHMDEFTDNLINTVEEEAGFDLDIKMNSLNRDEHEFYLFKQSKRQEKKEKELLNKTL